jgi:hypothetical protein
MCSLCAAPLSNEMWQLLHVHDWRKPGTKGWRTSLLGVVAVNIAVCNTVAVITNVKVDVKHQYTLPFASLIAYMCARVTRVVDRIGVSVK